MELERRRNPRVGVGRDGEGALVRGAGAVALRDISAGGLRLSLRSTLEPGGVYPLMAFLRGLSLATPIRITRCGPGGGLAGPLGERLPAWEAGAEFLWRDDDDAAAIRRWLDGRVFLPS